MNPDEALARVLALTGVALPRGVLGEESWELGRALAGEGPDDADVAALADRAARVHWETLRGPMEAAVLQGARAASGPDVQAFAIVGEWAGDPDPDNPFARALAVRAAVELAASGARARGLLREAEADLAAADDVHAAARATSVAGAVVVELLDLDPDDFLPEITEHIGASRGEDAVDDLARATGDAEIRGWARAAVAGIGDPQAPAATAALAQLAAGDPPSDPAHDLVWVPTILALVEQAIERALVDEASAAARKGE